ncbi:MAG: hypothetical protein IJX03_06535 [Clostridia bacterium]|nr:hypothetical protein [Clostridia bacterium]
MTERFSFFIYNLFVALGASGALFIGVIILAVAFITVLGLSLFCRGYSLKKRSWFIFLIIGVSIFVLAVSLICNNGYGYALIVLSIGVIFSAPIYSIRVKNKTTKEQRDLIRFIDGEIYGKCDVKKERDLPFTVDTPDKNVSSINCKVRDEEKVPELKTEKSQRVDLDFTHVKNVISRLSFFELSPTDKKQIKDLETAVYSAENGMLTPEIKNRVNDGLGALLKIMAKHGV